MVQAGDLVQMQAVAAAAAVVAGVAGTSRNCVVAKTGTGVFTVTLGGPVGIVESQMLVMLNLHTAGKIGTADRTSEFVITVSTTDAAATAEDVDFDITIFRLL